MKSSRVATSLSLSPKEGSKRVENFTFYSIFPIILSLTVISFAFENVSIHVITKRTNDKQIDR